MPKLLVLLASAESAAAALAERIAVSAKSVRFTEIDIRVAAPHQASTSGRHKVLEAADAVERYDGVIIASGGGDIPPALETLLDAWDDIGGSAFDNTVFAVVATSSETSVERSALFERVGRLGGIIVTEPRGGADAQARAELLGRRVAKVVDWVRHALSHEHAHHHHEH